MTVRVVDLAGGDQIVVQGILDRLFSEEQVGLGRARGGDKQSGANGIAVSSS